MKQVKQHGLAVLALLFSITAIALTLSVETVDDGQGHKRTTVTFHFDRSTKPGVQTGTAVVPKAMVDQAATQVELGLRDETPAAAEIAAPGELQAVQETVEQVKATQPPLPIAGASAGFQGCVTHFVRNQNSRKGVRPIWQALHYTVSGNRPGWSDVWAVVALFDRSDSQASSHFVIDGEGHCAYIVPIEAKAWTEAAGNSLSVGYEIINSGRESVYLAPAGMAKLRSVSRQVSARTGIPMRAGSVYPARGGFVQHKDGGLAWGGHIDITPFSSRSVITVLSARQPVAKSVKWARRHATLHKRYPQRCGRGPAGKGATPECVRLRAKNRTYHRLLARKRA